MRRSFGSGSASAQDDAPLERSKQLYKPEFAFKKHRPEAVLFGLILLLL